jgi:molybdate transport system substrate-binding protein
VDLARLYEAQVPEYTLQIESVGGVDAAKRVQAGEAFDCVVLASNAIDSLMQADKLVPGSRVDLVHSSVAVAVPAGASCPDIASEAALKQAVLQAPRIGYSTGPSGTELLKQFERWGIAEQVKACRVVPPPGTPVGSLVASGRASLGFQQLSELISIPGIEVVGTLPSDIAYITIFSSGIPTNLSHEATRLQSVQNFVKFLTSQEVETIKALNGMKGIRSSPTPK